MDDYITYIDFNSIKLADLANKIGDYKCAFVNYSKALNRLRKYQGDRMQPILMAESLVNKLSELENKIYSGNSILHFDSWKLTKSSFVKGSQCIKYLYLDKYKKQEKTPVTKEKQELFNQGHIFEDTVRNEDFPGGVNIKDKVGNFGFFNSYTKYLFNLSDSVTLYEATIIEDEVLVMCDIITKTENSDINVYEIKLNTELNEAIVSDLAVQYFICKKRFNSKLKSFNVILRTEDTSNNWKICNLSTKLEMMTDDVETKIREYKGVLTGTEPVIPMGNHCYKPYECEFIDYCKNKC